MGQRGPSYIATERTSQILAVIAGCRASLVCAPQNYSCGDPRTTKMILGRSRELGAKLTAWFESGISEAQPLVDSAAANAILEKQGAGRIYDRLFPDLQ